MKILVEDTKGSVVYADVTPKTTIRQLKTNFEVKDNVFLIYGTQILDSDDKTLEDLGIVESTILKCSGRLLGGKVHGSLAQSDEMKSKIEGHLKKFIVPMIVAGLSILSALINIVIHFVSRNQVRVAIGSSFMLVFDLMTVVWNGCLIIAGGLVFVGIVYIRHSFLKFYIVFAWIQFIAGFFIAIALLVMSLIVGVYSGGFIMMTIVAVSSIVYFPGYYFIFILPIVNSQKKIKQMKHKSQGGVMVMQI